MKSLHYLLMKSHGMISKRVLNEAGKIGLTSGQPKILEFLMKYGESDQKTIAAYCEIEPATVGSILLRMEQAELIVRKQKEGNRRSLYVSLTEKGQEAAVRMEKIFQKTEEQAAAGLTGGEEEQLKYLLDKLCRTIKFEKNKGE